MDRKGKTMMSPESNFKNSLTMRNLTPAILAMGLGSLFCVETATAQKDVAVESGGKEVVSSGKAVVVGGAVVRGVVYEDRDRDAVKDHIDPFKQGVVVDLLYDFDSENSSPEVGMGGKPGEQGKPGSDHGATGVRPPVMASGFELVATTTTNEDGSYRFSQLMPGDYKLRFEFSPEVMVRSDRITIATGEEQIFSVLPVIEDPTQAYYEELQIEVLSPISPEEIVFPPIRKTIVKTIIKLPPNGPNRPPLTGPPTVTSPPTTVSVFFPTPTPITVP